MVIWWQIILLLNIQSGKWKWRGAPKCYLFLAVCFYLVFIFLTRERKSFSLVSSRRSQTISPWRHFNKKFVSLALNCNKKCLNLISQYNNIIDSVVASLSLMLIGNVKNYLDISFFPWYFKKILYIKLNFKLGVFFLFFDRSYPKLGSMTYILLCRY